MGHYDDCYQATAEEDQRKKTEFNKGHLLKMQTQFRTLESLITGLEIEDSWREHLEQRLRELKALSKFYLS